MPVATRKHDSRERWIRSEQHSQVGGDSRLRLPLSTAPQMCGPSEANQQIRPTIRALRSSARSRRTGRPGKPRAAIATLVLTVQARDLAGRTAAAPGSARARDRRSPSDRGFRYGSSDHLTSGARQRPKVDKHDVAALGGAERLRAEPLVAASSECIRWRPKTRISLVTRTRRGTER
jgi:hypothetical protein